MKFNVGDRIKLRQDMYGGQLAKGSEGTIRDAFGLVSYKVKFDSVPRLVRVLESNLELA